MSLLAHAINAFERAHLPDPLRRRAVSFMVERARRQMRAAPADATTEFARQMADYPIAQNTADANAQHYELPADFFAACLGPRRKYSCCRFDAADDTLAVAEVRALAETCANARLADGQTILELGCGWGSLTLWMAKTYPNARIVAVSNSQSQRRHIEAEAVRKGFANLRVITADMNVFATDDRFDRIVSVEMFEHMSNWRALLARCRIWLEPDGLMLMHVFAHARAPYRFDIDDPADWIARYFFAGGVMPSRGLIREFSDLFSVEAETWWSGIHYERTALAWLANLDAKIETVRPILRETYGRAAPLWEKRWRLFFLSTAGMFGHERGREWGVVHHLLKPVRS